MAAEPDYYIVTIDTGCGPCPWRWEIRRRSSPMGVKLGAGGYQTEAAADDGGNQALSAFLEAHEREMRRR